MIIWIIIPLLQYRDVKKSFFDNLPKDAFVLTNVDDKNGAVMLQNTVANKRSYALKSYADYKHKFLKSIVGLLLKIEGNEVWVKLIGILMLIMRWQYMVLPLN
jgi:UDP-N-acetylmuramoyl-L-alanyl-D-glutamate--2,6-diaminopimelate ligase